jgi:hypothetical protein
MIGSHQPPTVVNRWRRGVGARVVLELAIVVGVYGCFGACYFRGPRSRTYEGSIEFTHTVSCQFDPFFDSNEVPGVGDPSP